MKAVILVTVLTLAFLFISIPVLIVLAMIYVALEGTN